MSETAHTTMEISDAGYSPPRWPLLLATAGIALIAGWIAGHAVAVTITAMALITLLAAIVDARQCRIPNSAPLGILAFTVVSIPLIAVLDDRAVVEAVRSSGLGVVLSGAPVLFTIWLGRPSAIGGGDWKLLGAVGATLGLVLPVAALVMTTIACFVQIIASTVRRSQLLPFGPSIAGGLMVTLLLLPTLVSTFGGPYA